MWKKKKRNHTSNLKNINDLAKKDSPNKAHKVIGNSDSTKTKSKKPEAECKLSPEPSMHSQRNFKLKEKRIRKL